MRSFFSNNGSYSMLIAILLFNTVWSIPTTIGQCELAAKNKLEHLDKSNYSIIDDIYVHNQLNGEKLFQIFGLSPHGYLVISADTRLPAVVAYSFENSFGDFAISENILLGLLDHDLQQRLHNIDSEIIHSTWQNLLSADNNITPNERFEQWPSEGSTSTGGWLESNWHQNSPFNNFCPVDLTNGNHSLAGCPAVAIAQILNYFRSINNTQFNDGDDYFHNYGSNQFWIDDDFVQYDFPSFPMLNSYLNTLIDHYQNNTPLTNDDKAALTFACGVAAQQVYSSGASGTFGVDQAFQAYQRFAIEECELLYASDGELFDRLSQNMIDAIPAHLAVVTPNWQSGHNVVVDGYNTDDYYHLNFGWGGTSNGWYLLPDEIPYGLSVIEGVIIDILPDEAVLLGDLNQDEIINVQEIILIVNIILGLEPTDEQFAAGDINNDNVIDVLDVILIVNIILGINL